MIRGLIFDFDGLIVDTEIAVYQSWQEIYEQHGCSLAPETWAHVVGSAGDEFDPVTDIEQQTGRVLHRDSLEKERERRELALGESLSMLPGVREYLADAAHLGLHIGLASSSPRSWVTVWLSRLGIGDRFEQLVCREDTVHLKPDPEPYRLVLARLGLESDEAIVLEDSPHGVRAAAAAGIFCVAVPTALTGHLPIERADLRLASLADMPLFALINHIEAVRERKETVGGSAR